MDQDQQIARDRHQEVIASIASLRTELTATRLEVKTDLQASRTEYLDNLKVHQADDNKHFDDIAANIESISTWKTRTMAFASVAVFGFTTLAAFASAAFASGRL